LTKSQSTAQDRVFGGAKTQTGEGETREGLTMGGGPPEGASQVRSKKKKEGKSTWRGRSGKTKRIHAKKRGDEKSPESGYVGEEETKKIKKDYKEKKKKTLIREKGNEERRLKMTENKEEVRNDGETVA